MVNERVIRPYRPTGARSRFKPLCESLTRKRESVTARITSPADREARLDDVVSAHDALAAVG
jgi:hypothetical protein